MKKTQFLFLVIIVIFFNSCEEVVNIDLNTAPPKLVIEAALNWQKGTSGNEQKIKLTTTTDYFNAAIPKVLGATVFVKNSSNVTFDFVEKPNTGEYVCTNFIPQLNETYSLTVINNGQTYTATESMKPVAPITKILQNNQGGFTGNKIEIKAFFNDPDNEENYYLYKYLYSSQIKSNYYADEDTFFQGNEFFSISQNSDIKIGDKVTISHYGISKTYYNYMRVLVSIAGNNNGGPFQSPPVNVRGNIMNTTNFDNYALGYFSISEADTNVYTVQ